MCMQGLACGANAEGTPFGSLALLQLPGAASASTYAAHFNAFMANLKGRARAFAQA